MGNCFGADSPPSSRPAAAGYGSTGQNGARTSNGQPTNSAADASRRRQERAAAAENRARSTQNRGKSSTGNGRSSALGEDALLYGDINANRADGTSPAVQNRAKTQWELENQAAIGATILNTRDKA